MNALFWLLLPVAAISGWMAAFRHFKSLANNNVPDVYAYSPRAKKGGDFIYTEPDKAVDIVIDQVEVTPDTVEVHLALGNLYRRSGEVSRAIRFHQNLSEKHALSNPQRENILFELGRDYLSAGLLDRAERIFKDLLTADEFKVASCKALVEVYQQEKDWDAAIEYAEIYQRLSKKSQKNRIAHYYCEKAEKIKIKGKVDPTQVIPLLQFALKKDRSCVRANILLGDMSYSSLEYGKSLEFYMAAVSQDGAFLPVVFDNLICSIQLSPKTEQLVSLLPSAFTGGSSEGMLTGHSEIPSNKNKAINYVELQLGKTPSLTLLEKYFCLLSDGSQSVERKAISQIQNALSQINKTNASYKCVSCGLGVHALQWQCPSCSSWSTIKPL